MTNLNIRVDEQLKADAQALYKSLGMDLSTAINVFLRQSVQMQGLPFRPHLSPAYPSHPVDITTLTEQQLDAELEKGYADIAAGRAYEAKSVFDSIRRDYDL